MRTIEDLDRDTKQFLHPRVAGVDLFGRDDLLRDFRLPADTEQPPSVSRVAAQELRAAVEHRDLAGGDAAIPGQHAVTPDDQCAVDERRVADPDERHRIDAREPFRGMRRLELALVAKLHRRPERADVAPDRLLDLLRREQPAEFTDHARRGVHLRILDAGREPDAPHRQSAPGRRLRQCRARLARHIGVVEHDPRVPCGDEAVERRQSPRSEPPPSSR